MKGLSISVDGNKLYALNARINHTIDCSTTSATHTNNFNARECFNSRINCLCHILLLPLRLDSPLVYLRLFQTATSSAYKIVLCVFGMSKTNAQTTGINGLLSNKNYA